MGDGETNPLSAEKTMASIFNFVDALCSHNVMPVAVGADVVEVCPPYDSADITAILAANLLYEMLWVLPGASQG
jgi:arginase family enzyme